MCGIAGILRVHPPGQAPPPPWVAIPEAWLDILDESVKHRGPDGHGRFRDRAVRPDGSVVDVAFVHRRLSIIDHAGGHQPMILRAADGAPHATQDSGLKTQDLIPPGADAASYRRTADHALKPCPRCAALGRGTIAVVFNGCIYNHRELRKELQAAGHEFSTDHSDTEVLVHGWAEWRLAPAPHGSSGTGDSCPLPRSGEPAPTDRLDGMYACAIWCGADGLLDLTRDLAGEKPCYFATTGSPRAGVLAFASSAAGVARWLRCVQAPTRVSDGLWHWLIYGWGYDDPTGAVHQCIPGGLQGFTAGGVGFLRAGTELKPTERGERTTLDAATVDDALIRAVGSRLEADVALGCFLSGGIDSSLVALMAQRHLHVRGGHLRTFTVRMPDPRFDESGFASRVAAIIGSDHTTLDTQPEPARDLQALIAQLGLPLGDSSLLPTYWVSRATRTEVTVALGGDGGDELFCGYERHRAWAALRGWSAVLRRVPASVFPDRDPRSSSSKMRRLATAARHDGYDSLLALFQAADRHHLLGGEVVLKEVSDPARHDFDGYLPHDLLRKVDTASMAVALEVRAPLLSRDLVARCLAEPLSSLMRGGRKGLLRAVARKYFPPEIVDRPKQGFAIPIGEWFRNDYGGMRQLLLDHLNGPEPFGPDHLGINAMINMDFVKQMLREHDDAGVKSLWPWKGRDHSQRLYMMLVLSIWAKWLGGL